MSSGCFRHDSDSLPVAPTITAITFTATFQTVLFTGKTSSPKCLILWPLGWKQWPFVRFVTTYSTTNRHIPEDLDLQEHRCENLQSCRSTLLLGQHVNRNLLNWTELSYYCLQCRFCQTITSKFSTQTQILVLLTVVAHYRSEIVHHAIRAAICIRTYIHVS